MLDQGPCLASICQRMHESSILKKRHSFQGKRGQENRSEQENDRAQASESILAQDEFIHLEYYHGHLRDKGD